MNYDEMFDSVETTQTNRSGLFDQLESSEQDDVKAFLAWLPLKRNTVNSYKTYICKAMLKFSGKLPGDLTSDEKSAVKKFRTWHEMYRAED
jgi:hypothetical protein